MYKTQRDYKSLGSDMIFERLKQYNTGYEHIDFREVRCVAAPFGGPVAFAPILGKGQIKTSLSIQIFTAAGSRLGIINTLENLQDIVGIGWNDVEDLVIVMKNRAVYIYSLFGELKRKFNIPAEREEIKEAKIWGNGFACLTKSRRVVTMLEFESDHTSEWGGKTATGHFPKDPTCWVVIEPQLSQDKSLEVFFASPIGSIYVISRNVAKEMASISPNGSPIVKMAVSPSGKLLACVNSLGRVWVIQVDFAKEHLFFDTNITVPPYQLEWCGEAAVVCYWRTELNNVMLVVGPNAQYFKYQDTEPLHLVSECDGLRIFSPEGCEFLYPVHEKVIKVFPYTEEKSNKQVTSGVPSGPNHLTVTSSVQILNPAAKLFKASQMFHHDKICVEDIIEDIRKTLPQAISAVAEASGYEFDVERQQALLEAAAFGISFLESCSFLDTIVAITKTLRVLHSMREPDIGIPLSYQQYQILTPEILIDRLIGRNQHMLAYEICQYLGLKTDKVLVRWAKKKLCMHTMGETEEDIARVIKDRLQKSPGVSFASIAYEAYKLGREELATMLLDAEPRASDQVPLLIHMRKYEVALDKAIKSGDTNLIHLVLAVFREDSETGDGSVIDFENVLRRHKPGNAIWTQICKETNNDQLLMKMYQKEKMVMEMVQLELRKAYANKDLQERQNHIKSMVEIFKKTQNYPIETKLTEDEHSLLLMQKELEVSLGGTFVGSSLTHTLYRCIVMGAGKRAKKIRREFNVPNKRWWWIKIRALADTGRWEALKSFSNQKSPVGYKPFADVCLQRDNKKEAKYYVNLMENNEAKVMLYLQLDAWDDAILTVETLDFPEETLDKMKGKVKDPAKINQINSLLEKYQAQ